VPFAFGFGVNFKTAAAIFWPALNFTKRAGEDRHGESYRLTDAKRRLKRK
jgi:hypothetical protein